ncbi:hypothetical protein Q6264_31770, partial [Klebsiella pneumoniae]|uniref:hypothetical protein n=1 Tax=Klebsiella pneumoniae TaxID=573 RepID=UPI00272FA521
MAFSTQDSDEVLSEINVTPLVDVMLVLLVLAADHLIEDVAAFHASLELALPLARAGKLVTFGITPT